MHVDMNMCVEVCLTAQIVMINDENWDYVHTLDVYVLHLCPTNTFQQHPFTVEIKGLPSAWFFIA